MNESFFVFIKNWSELISFITMIISLIGMIFAIIFAKKQIDVNKRQMNFVEVESYKLHFLKYRSIMEKMLHFNFNYSSYDNQQLVKKMCNEFALIANEMSELISEAEVLNFEKNILYILQQEFDLMKNYATYLRYLNELLQFNQESVKLEEEIITQKNCKKELENFKQLLSNLSIYKIQKLYTQQIKSLLH